MSGAAAGLDFAVVVAADEDRGIGRAGALPWRLPADMAFFRRLTSEVDAPQRNAVIMGRATFDSIPPKFRPLAGRLNVVISRGAPALPDGVLLASSLDHALALCAERADVARVFVIGGAQIYALALVHPRCRRVFLTRVHGHFECDAFLAPLGDAFRLGSEGVLQHEGNIGFRFQTYDRSDAALGETSWA